MTLTRRDLFKRSAAAGAGLVVAGNLDALFLAGPAAAAPATGIGPLVPDPQGVLDLPPGFRYRLLSRAGDPLVGHAGVVPGRPDSMGVFDARGGSTIVRNHEQSNAGVPAVAVARTTYDPGALGGTTTLRLTRDNRLVDEYVSLAGTFSNCSGGITPWDTWLTCEETETLAGGSYTKDHGWVFEVDPHEPDHNLDPTPLKGLGRFAHEAAAVDPQRGQVYLTEDASAPNGLLYRFTPDHRPRRYGDLRGAGLLEALAVPGVTDLSTFDRIGTTLQVAWRKVPDPSALAQGPTRKQFTYRDFATSTTVVGPGGDVTRSKKFEGLWWGEGRLFVACSYAHGADDWSEGSHSGQVWSYDPRRSTLRLEVRFAASTDVDGRPDGPDNITVSPYGGLFLAEDGEGQQHLLSVDRRGRTSFFARNALSGSEFTGVVFSPDARTLFANIQDEGLTFAIEGPFQRLGRAGDRDHRRE